MVPSIGLHRATMAVERERLERAARDRRRPREHEHAGFEALTRAALRAGDDPRRPRWRYRKGRRSC